MVCGGGGLAPQDRPSAVQWKSVWKVAVPPVRDRGEVDLHHKVMGNVQQAPAGVVGGWERAQLGVRRRHPQTKYYGWDALTHTETLTPTDDV